MPIGTLNTKPLVSVIMTTYNRPRYIAEALQSVYAQTYDNIEIFVVDDASSDNQTIDVVKQEAEKSPFPIKLALLKRNVGPGGAREVARKLANGAYVQYLDSDDLIVSRKIERQVEALESSSCLDIAYGLTLALYENQSTVQALKARDVYRRSDEAHDRLLPATLGGRLWGTATPLYRADLLEKVGPWLPLSINEDIEYEFRVGDLSRGLYYDAEPVAMVRFHTDRLVLNVESGSKNLKDRIRAHISIVRLVGKKEDFDASYRDYTNFWLNIFFLARKAASIGDKQSMNTLLDAFFNSSDLPKKQRVRAMAFRWVGLLFGVKMAGRISDYLERVKKQ